MVSEAQGLMSALELWAAKWKTFSASRAAFECENPVLIHDDTMATHLYHIAQEAVNNAIKHGEARNIVIRVGSRGWSGSLVIRDDGKGIAGGQRAHRGMGLHIMNYRAGMIGGTLEVQPGTNRGTIVTCIFPASEARVKRYAHGTTEITKSHEWTQRRKKTVFVVDDHPLCARVWP